MASVDWNAQLNLYLPKIGVDPSQVPGTLLQSLGSACQAAVERFISRTFDEQGYVEAYDGNDRNVLYLNHDPITALVSVSLFGTALAFQADPTAVPTYPLPLVVAAGSPIRSKLKLTDGSTFPCGNSNVIVSYKAGLSTKAVPVPADLVFAVTYWAGLMFKGRSYVGISSQTFKEQITTFSTALPKSVQGMIDGWQRANLS